MLHRLICLKPLLQLLRLCSAPPSSSREFAFSHSQYAAGLSCLPRVPSSIRNRALRLLPTRLIINVKITLFIVALLTSVLAIVGDNSSSPLNNRSQLTRPDAVSTVPPTVRGDWMLFHPVYTPEEVKAVEVCVVHLDCLLFG